MATTKTTIPVTTGSGTNLLAELESDGSKVEYNYIFEGRLIPTSDGASSRHVVTVSTTADVDLMTKIPVGQGTNFLRVMVPTQSSTGTLTWWDNGLSPGTVTPAPQITSGNYFDFPNVPEMTTLYSRATGASVSVILLWYKTK